MRRRDGVKDRGGLADDIREVLGYYEVIDDGRTACVGASAHRVHVGNNSGPGRFWEAGLG